jgi:prepilin-type N-terminal cleavage/methylation domain-containing protein
MIISSSIRRPAARTGFTLLEVMVSAAILALGIAGVVTVSQQGLLALDTSRHLSAASSVMQSEMERLRLMSWAQLQIVQDAGNQEVPVDENQGRYTCLREIKNVKPGMKEITLVSTWKGMDGQTHTARLVTRYGKTGLNDYFYTAH